MAAFPDNYDLDGAGGQTPPSPPHNEADFKARETAAQHDTATLQQATATAQQTTATLQQATATAQQTTATLQQATTTVHQEVSAALLRAVEDSRAAARARSESSAVPEETHAAQAEVALDPADGAPADGAPADVAPADGAPADGAPADDAPRTGAAADEPVDREYGGVYTGRNHASGGRANGFPIFRGPRGGCYYVNSNGNKTFVEEPASDVAPADGASFDG